MAGHENQSVLVTGGCGFIGRAVCLLLQRHGFRVVSLDHPDLCSGSGDCPGITKVWCDIADAAAVKRVFQSERIDRVIHLAAVLPTAAQRDPVRATEVNIQGSQNVIEMARQLEVHRVVFGSSLSVYGTCPAKESVSEQRTAAPEDLYGAAKLYVERLGESYCSQRNLAFASLRIGRVIGPGAKSVSSAWRSQIIESLRASERVEICVPFAPTERILLVRVDDVARMLVALVTALKLNHSVYNACCESVVVDELRRWLESLNPKLQIKLGSQPAVGNPKRLDCSRFGEEFNFRPEPILETLRRAARQLSD